MNAINYALSVINKVIPEQILYLTFIENNDKINQVISLDERILTSVVRPRILVDCNIVGGIMTKIPVAKCIITTLATNEFIIEVPKLLTNNKSIINVLSLVSNVNYGLTGYMQNDSQLLAAAYKMYNNVATEPVVQTSRLDLIGDNVVLVEDPNINLINGVLRVNIENNTNMENLNPRFYLHFSKLVELGIKSYIYNKMVIKLNQGYVYAGHELGTIKDTIDGYADAEEMYKEYLVNTFQKVSFMNQSERMERYLVSMLGNSI